MYRKVKNAPPPPVYSAQKSVFHRNPVQKNIFKICCDSKKPFDYYTIFKKLPNDIFVSQELLFVFLSIHLAGYKMTNVTDYYLYSKTVSTTSF